MLLIGSGCYIWLGSLIEQQSETNADGTAPYAIILGASVKPDGKPSKLLQSRLDIAIPYLQQHPDVQVIVTGGIEEEINRTAADVMAEYLIVRGIDPQRIILEEYARNTHENMVFSKELLNGETHVTLISNEFHLYRATWLAHNLALEVDTIAVPTPEQYVAKNEVRERLAIIKDFLVSRDTSVEP